MAAAPWAVGPLARAGLVVALAVGASGILYFYQRQLYARLLACTVRLRLD